MKKIPKPLFFCDNPVLSIRSEKTFETKQKDVTFVPSFAKKDIVELTVERLKQKLERLKIDNLEENQRFYPNVNLTFNRNDFGYGGKWSIFVENINNELRVCYVNSDRSDSIIHLQTIERISDFKLEQKIDEKIEKETKLKNIC